LSEPAIFYDCPDWADEPAGGVLCIYRHVEMLHQAGFSASVLHERRGHRAGWFRHDAPVAWREEGAGPQAGDVLVLPEISTGRLRATAGAPYRRFVFAQSWMYILSGLRPGEDWRSFGIGRGLSVSRYVQRFLAETLGLPSDVVHPPVDTERFRPGPKRLQIACMPRKNRRDLQQIEAIFRARFPEHRAIPFVPIDGVPHERVAEVLAESALFLATGYPEGCPLPPLEAMACGCLAVGFTGRGGREFMHHRRNCLTAQDGDVLTATGLLGEAVQAVLRGEDGPLRQSARTTAERFAPARVAKNLIRTWSRILEKAVE
jgi:Glycosyl transferases group 1